MFLSTTATIAVYGGAAGGGKTFAALLDHARWVHLPDYRGIFFRRTFAQVTQGGGPWDEASKIYPHLGGKPRKMEWVFPSGARVIFSHLQREDDKFSHDGAQYGLVTWDELVHFTETQFWYLVSRLRTNAPMQPYMRAGTNPPREGKDHWLYRLVSWWIADDGFPDPSRAGVIRWFVRVNDELIWADTRDELIKYDPDPKSFTFIPAKLSDNPKLLEHDPGYESRLKALPLIERQRLLNGNWHVSAEAGSYFRGEWFERLRVPPRPEAFKRVVRYWDRAATKPSPSYPDPDWTVGVLMGLKHDGGVVILDVVRFRDGPGGVAKRVREVGIEDVKHWKRYALIPEVDPGQAGKAEKLYLSRALSGLPVRWERPTASKEDRALAFSAAAEAGNVEIVMGEWNNEFIRELENFPHGGHDDQVDAATGAYNYLVKKGHGIFL